MASEVVGAELAPSERLSAVWLYLLVSTLEIEVVSRGEVQWLAPGELKCPHAEIDLP